MQKGFTYEQSTGKLSITNGEYDTPLYVGVAGAEGWRNDPESQHLRNKGPLPRGIYSMRVVAHRRFSPPAIELTWNAWQAEGMGNFGRSGFWIHGGTKSEGCILVNGSTRNLIATAIGLGFDTLWVIR